MINRNSRNSAGGIYTSNGIQELPYKKNEFSFKDNSKRNGIFVFFLLILSLLGVPYILINLQDIINLF